MDNKNQPAFPYSEHDIVGNSLVLECKETGLTKREYFAGLAMQGILANHWCCKEKHKSLFSSRESIAALSYAQVAQQATQYADAILAELEKR